MSSTLLRCCAREFKPPWRLLPPKPLSLLLLLPYYYYYYYYYYCSCCPITAPCSSPKPLSSLPRNQRLKPTQVSPLSSSRLHNYFNWAFWSWRQMSSITPVPLSCWAPRIESSFILFGSKLTPALKQTPIFQSSHGWLLLFKEWPDASRNFLRFSNGQRARKAPYLPTPPQVAASIDHSL